MTKSTACKRFVLPAPGAVCVWEAAVVGERGTERHHMPGAPESWESWWWCALRQSRPSASGATTPGTRLARHLVWCRPPTWCHPPRIWCHLPRSGAPPSTGNQSQRQTASKPLSWQHLWATVLIQFAPKDPYFDKKKIRKSFNQSNLLSIFQKRNKRWSATKSDQVRHQKTDIETTYPENWDPLYPDKEIL